MRYRKLGNTGLDVSPICIGCMSFGEPERGDHPWTNSEEVSRPLLKAAVEAGINFFDTANAYSGGSSEEITGRALADFGRRDELVVATKVFMPVGKGPNLRGLSRKAIFQEVDNSLRRLGMDYVDLLQIHRYDSFTPIEETMEALHDVVKSGRARYLGASSMFAWQFAKAQHVAREHGWTPFVSMQNHLNLLYREEEREMIPMCIDMGVGVIPWSPLARGRLTRPWDSVTDRSTSDRVLKSLYQDGSGEAIVSAVVGVAGARGVPQAQVALAWVSQRSGVTAPIVGLSKISQLDDALASLEIQLTPEEVAAIEAPYVPQPISGHA
jgi:1-deoxyxylulose-5-phosphate synthase